RERLPHRALPAGLQQRGEPERLVESDGRRRHRQRAVLALAVPPPRTPVAARRSGRPRLSGRWGSSRSWRRRHERPEGAAPRVPPGAGWTARSPSAGPRSPAPDPGTPLAGPWPPATAPRPAFLQLVKTETHRGLEGRALGGFWTGGRVYGYALRKEENPPDP